MSTDILYEIYLRQNAGNYFNSGNPYTGAIANTSEINIGYERDKEYRGIFRKITAPLIFHGQAADDIQAVFNNGFVNAEIECEIRVKNSTTQGYDLLGVFDFDWTTYKKIDDGIECELKQGGLTQVIETNKDVPYQIDFQEGLEAKINVQWTGMWFFGYQEWITANYRENNSGGGGIGSDTFELYPPLQTLDRQTEYNEITGASSQGKFTNTSISQEYFTLITANRTGALLFTGIMPAYYKVTVNTVRLKLYADVFSPAGALLSHNTLWQDPAGNLTAGNDRTVTVSFTNVAVNVSAGNTVRVYFGDKELAGGTYEFACDDKGYLRVDTRFTLPTTTVITRPIHSVFSRLIGRMSDFQYTLNAPYLTYPAYGLYDYTPSNTVYTSDGALRGDAIPRMTVTFSDVWKDIYSRDSVGLCVENEQIVIKTLSQIYSRNSVIYDLGEVAEMEITVATDLLYNIFRIGYDTKNTEDNNGSFAYNIEQVYKSAFKDKFSEADWKSPFVADPFTIEKIRNQSFQKDTNKGSNSTDGVYVADVENAQGTWILRRASTYSGFPFDMNPYNFALSPKRTLYRKAQEIASHCYKLDGLLKFQAQDRPIFNITSRMIGGDTYVEATDTQISTESLLFIPLFFEFEAKKIPNNFLYLLENNRYGVLRFSYMGKTYEGFIEEIGIKGKEASSYKLLCSPNVNFE